MNEKTIIILKRFQGEFTALCTYSEDQKVVHNLLQERSKTVKTRKNMTDASLEMSAISSCFHGYAKQQID